MTMNVLSRLLDVAAKCGMFAYHSKCNMINLTHLCFVDELLLFAKGDRDSIMGIKKMF